MFSFKQVCCLSLALGVAAFAATANAQSATAGKTLYLANCNSCHGFPNYPLVQKGAAASVIQTAIATKVPKMNTPALTGLTSANLSDLAAYLNSMRGCRVQQLPGTLVGAGRHRGRMGHQLRASGRPDLRDVVHVRQCRQPMVDVDADRTHVAHEQRVLRTRLHRHRSGVQRLHGHRGADPGRHRDADLHRPGQWRALLRRRRGRRQRPADQADHAFPAQHPDQSAGLRVRGGDHQPVESQATNYQDLWWVPNGVESGWGINFAHQGPQLFATWYTYGTTDQPMWLSVLATQTAAEQHIPARCSRPGPALRRVRQDEAQSRRLRLATRRSPLPTAILRR